MSDVTPPAHADHAHHGPNLQAYMVIGLALSIFTAVSFI
jgi:hypothetical protein